jgi:hypothetical protein
MLWLKVTYATIDLLFLPSILKFNYSATSVLKKEAAGLFETSTNTRLKTRSYNPDDHYRHFHHNENLNCELYSKLCPYYSQNSHSDIRCSHTKHNETCINIISTSCSSQREVILQYHTLHKLTQYYYS